ncbi:type I restriction-modification system subunit M [Serratia nevei]|uniref:type I restriction-modification system subunit M n=1 Tax=Serratia nevei TaxID=2703794 RepID=UPI0020A09514|nr:type I restriction-modification system subunit M [Serratia nevei]MCP1105733.1 type I restriction-modification system subunit M [Serratia nevei]
MTSIQQRAALQRQIWAIANKVRGAVDGWDFKQYVLGALFYRFISENFTSYIEAGDDSINYAELPDSVITREIKEDAIKTKGYFIRPSDLFVNVVKNANDNDSLNTDLAHIFADIEASASGYPSERDIKGLFADFDTTSNRLGNTVKDKNARLAEVLKGVAGLDFGDFAASHIDLFGDAYEFLISNYAANAGKSGGEFFTPQHVSKLIAQLAMHGQTSVNKIYDPACGSGSLLLQAKKHFDAHIIEEGFFGQEINHTTYNLARMNMFLHNINYDKFNIQLGNTLTEPHFGDDKPFDAIVSNPPYSVKWIGSDDPTLINDDRFAPAGVLAPKSKADFAFVLHALSYLSSKGRAAIVCFPGIFYRGGAEQKIRQYLVDNNYVETVISLAPNLFYGTTIAVNILVLAKNKKETTTQFIDASNLFKKETNNNVLLDMHIEQIMQVFDSKANVDHFAQSVPFEKLVANDYNLSVSSYVEVKDTREVVDIAQLNAELKTIVVRIDQLRAKIDVIVAEIEGGELEV